MAHSMAIYGLYHLRARLAGEIDALEERNRARATKIALMQATVETTNTKIAELRAAINHATEAGQAAFGVDLSSTVPRRTYPKKHYTSWGGLTRSILEELKTSRESALTSMDLSQLLNVRLCLELDLPGLYLLNRSVGYTLKRLANKGVVNRVRRENSLDQSVSWVIAATEE